MPTLLREIVRDAFATQPWAEVVAEYESPLPLDEAAQTASANVVVVGAAPWVEPEADALLEASRRIGVLSISADGRETMLYELHPNKQPLGEVSAARLIEAARRAVSLPVEA